MGSKAPSVKIIHVSLISRFMETCLLDTRWFLNVPNADLSWSSTRIDGPGFLECHDRTLVAAFSLLPKTKVRNQTILPCNLSRVLVPTELWLRISSMHSRSSFDLSSVCPTLTSRFPTFSVLTTSPKVLKQSENGGAFDPSEAKFMPSSLNKASA